MRYYGRRGAEMVSLPLPPVCPERLPRVREQPQADDGLTALQRKLYDYVRGFHQRHGRCPRQREMVVALHLESARRCRDLCVALAAKGFLRLTPGKSQGKGRPPLAVELAEGVS